MSDELRQEAMLFIIMIANVPYLSPGIHVTGFSPLGSPSYIELNMDRGEGVGLLKDPLLIGIAGTDRQLMALIDLSKLVYCG
jgi:hypothetical protein